VCEAYLSGFSDSRLREELRFFKTLTNDKKAFDILVGLSGGKDSSASLLLTKKLGFRPLAFTFDIGYYPEHEFERAAKVAEALGVNHVRIDIRKYIRENDRTSYLKTVKLYEHKPSLSLRKLFLKTFQEDKLHNSPKCAHSRAFVRTCRLCRHTVIRAYYGEAVKRGVRVVALGMNEYAGRLRQVDGGEPCVSAIRVLNPCGDNPVYVVHLPFLLRRTVKDTQRTLQELGWKMPPGEDFIESNSNSCLFARSAEAFSTRMLGFHPDTPRLAREVTVGYLTKTQARRALMQVHTTESSMRRVLEDAKIL
jgi:hypothetical protein